MSEKIKGFDGIRGLAVISVVLSHTNFWKTLEDKGYISASFVPLFQGIAGVQAFFILSGFLITILLIREHEKTGKISIKNFIIRRALRIFPLYVLFIILATLLHVFGENVTNWESLYYSYFYIYNFIPVNIYTSFLGHTWSLAVEEHFYIIWPAVFLVFYRYGYKLLSFFIVTAVLASLLIHYWLLHTDFSRNYFIDRWSFIAGYNIALGCLAAILFKSKDIGPYLNNMFNRPLIILFGFFVYVSSVYLPGDSWFLEHVFSNYLRSLGILIFVSWLYINQSSVLIKFLEFPLLKYIGLISYGIYMYQGLFLATGPARDPSRSWPPDQSIGIFLLMFSAPLSYQFFEKPFLRLRNKFR